MKYRDLLERILWIWRGSALAAIAALLPILFGMWIGTGVYLRMMNLGDSNHFADPSRWAEWLLFTCPFFCLLCAVPATAAGVTYFIGKQLNDYTGIVSLA